MISGSSIANTVTVGSLTIPAMIRLGYPRHFAGAVEAAAATGGQITPPIMGAAAFLMVEFLERPLPDDHHRRDRAGLHAFLRRVLPGALRGEEARPARPDRAPRCRMPREVIRRDWPTVDAACRAADRSCSRASRPISRRSGASPAASFVGLTQSQSRRRGRVRRRHRARASAFSILTSGEGLAADHRRVDRRLAPGPC